MKYLCERHKCAPELNRIYRVIGDKMIEIARASSAIGKQAFASLAEYRKLNAPVEPFIHAKVQTHYANPDHKWLERTYAGRVASRADALAFKRKIAERLAPGGSVSLKTQLAF